MSKNFCSVLLGFSIRWGNPLFLSPRPTYHQVPALLGCSETSAPAELRHWLSQLLHTVSGALVVSHDCSRGCPLPESVVTAGIAWLLQVPLFSPERAHGACHEALSPVSQLRASPDIIFSSTSIPPVVVILTFLLHVSYYRPGTETEVLPQSQQVVQFSYLCCSDLAFRSSTDNARA